MRWILVVTVACALAAARPAAASPVVGRVKSVSGTCFVVRGGQQMKLTAGQPLRQGDRLQTAGDGRLGVVLRDDTLVSLGQRTELEVRKFQFEPAEGKLGMVLEMLRGVVSYISGQIARLDPDSVQFVTPVATVGVRGTHFLAKVSPE